MLGQNNSNSSLNETESHVIDIAIKGRDENLNACDQITQVQDYPSSLFESSDIQNDAASLYINSSKLDDLLSQAVFKIPQSMRLKKTQLSQKQPSNISQKWIQQGQKILSALPNWTGLTENERFSQFLKLFSFSPQTTEPQVFISYTNMTAQIDGCYRHFKKDHQIQDPQTLMSHFKNVVCFAVQPLSQSLDNLGHNFQDLNQGLCQQISQHPIRFILMMFRHMKSNELYFLFHFQQLELPVPSDSEDQVSQIQIIKKQHDTIKFSNQAQQIISQGIINLFNIKEAVLLTDKKLQQIKNLLSLKDNFRKTEILKRNCDRIRFLSETHFPCTAYQMMLCMNETQSLQIDTLSEQKKNVLNLFNKACTEINLQYYVTEFKWFSYMFNDINLDEIRNFTSDQIKVTYYKGLNYTHSKFQQSMIDTVKEQYVTAKQNKDDFVNQGCYALLVDYYFQKKRTITDWITKYLKESMKAHSITYPLHVTESEFKQYLDVNRGVISKGQLKFWDLLTFKDSQILSFVWVAIYMSKALIVPYTQLLEQRNKKCLYVVGDSSTGKSYILTILGEIFKGIEINLPKKTQKLWVLPNVDDFAISLVHEVDTMQQLLNGDCKQLLDTTQSSIGDIKYEHAQSYGLGMPVIMASNQLPTDFYKEIFSRQEELYKQQQITDCSAILNRITIIPFFQIEDEQGDLPKILKSTNFMNVFQVEPNTNRMTPAQVYRYQFTNTLICIALLYMDKKNLKYFADSTNAPLFRVMMDNFKSTAFGYMLCHDGNLSNLFIESYEQIQDTQSKFLEGLSHKTEKQIFQETQFSFSQSQQQYDFSQVREQFYEQIIDLEGQADVHKCQAQVKKMIHMFQKCTRDKEETYGSQIYNQFIQNLKEIELESEQFSSQEQDYYSEICLSQESGYKRQRLSQ